MFQIYCIVYTYLIAALNANTFKYIHHTDVRVVLLIILAIRVYLLDIIALRDHRLG